MAKSDGSLYGHFNLPGQPISFPIKLELVTLDESCQITGLKNYDLEWVSLFLKVLTHALCPCLLLTMPSICMNKLKSHPKKSSLNSYSSSWIAANLRIFQYSPVEYIVKLITCSFVKSKNQKSCVLIN